MGLFEFRSEIPAGQAELADEALLEQQAAEWAVFEEVDAKRAWVVGVFAERAVGQRAWDTLAAHLAAGGIARGELVVRSLADADWKDSYKSHFKAWQCDSLHWVPEWERDTYVIPAGARVLWLDPGMAFGTGNHETTRLCCERLVEFARRRGVGRVLDAGCGSGILALSAAGLGLGPVVGFDNDPVAVEVSQANARLNNLVADVEFIVADLPQGLARRQADLLMANIQADVLGRFARELGTAVAPGGELVLSGILRRELVGVRAQFVAQWPEWDVDSREQGEWSDLRLTRPSAQGEPTAT